MGQFLAPVNDSTVWQWYFFWITIMHFTHFLTPVSSVHSFKVQGVVTKVVWTQDIQRTNEGQSCL